MKKNVLLLMMIGVLITGCSMAHMSLKDGKKKGVSLPNTLSLKKGKGIPSELMIERVFSPDMDTRVSFTPYSYAYFQKENKKILELDKTKVGRKFLKKQLKTEWNSLSKNRVCFSLGIQQVGTIYNRITYKAKEWSGIVVSGKNKKVFPLYFSSYFSMACTESRFDTARPFSLIIKSPYSSNVFSLDWKTNEKDEYIYGFSSHQAIKKIYEENKVSRFMSDAAKNLKLISASVNTKNIKSLRKYFPKNKNYTFDDHVLFTQMAIASARKNGGSCSNYTINYLKDLGFIKVNELFDRDEKHSIEYASSCFSTAVPIYFNYPKFRNSIMTSFSNGLVGSLNSYSKKDKKVLSRARKSYYKINQSLDERCKSDDAESCILHESTNKIMKKLNKFKF
jgi:hypothetical protein